MQPAGNQAMQGQQGGAMQAPTDQGGGSSKMLVIIIGAIAAFAMLGCVGGLVYVFFFA
jgi:hypothetical protein